MKNFPTLYKKTSTGAIQFWTICVLETPNSGILYDIETEYGQLGTDSPQTTIDTIAKGKNIGKKNQTTAYDQAIAEAQAKWEKQKKKGYVESLEAAEKGELDKLIEGGIVPMLAHKFSDHGHKIKYPAYAQPKLDGIRCIAILKDGKCTLWSRTRKQITSVPHIQRAVESWFKQDIVLDGELYNHELKSNFEKIISMVRQEEPAEGHEIVQYHIYDTVSEKEYAGRWGDLFNFFRNVDVWEQCDPLRLVNSFNVNDEEEVSHWFEVFKRDGYEGAMLRNAESPYVNKRSYDLQKVKEFNDEEFDIVGIDEGRGKLQGHVGAFVCLTSDGKEFLAKMSGETAKLKEYFENHKLWQGKQLTVKFQGLTGTNGVPRFPVGVAIRDYE
jgi:DNA ligase 1